MANEININSIYGHSQEIVAREIEGELIIVPITNGVGDMEDEIFSLNDTGRDIWNALDGKRTLREVVTLLSEEFDADAGVIEKDVLGFVAEVLRRNIVVEVTGD